MVQTMSYRMVLCNVARFADVLLRLHIQVGGVRRAISGGLGFGRYALSQALFDATELDFVA